MTLRCLLATYSALFLGALLLTLIVSRHVARMYGVINVQAYIAFILTWFTCCAVIAALMKWRFNRS
jgi:prepilin signal peptidase PulO-like enzyme (type II secretory pathway)